MEKIKSPRTDDLLRPFVGSETPSLREFGRLCELSRRLERELTVAQVENAAMRECLRKIAALDPVPRYVAFYLDVLQVEKGVVL